MSDARERLTRDAKAQSTTKGPELGCAAGSENRSSPACIQPKLVMNGLVLRSGWDASREVGRDPGWDDRQFGRSSTFGPQSEVEIVSIDRLRSAYGGRGKKLRFGGSRIGGL